MGMSFADKREFHRMAFAEKSLDSAVLEEIVQGMTPDDQMAFHHDWHIWARDKQLAQNLPHELWTHWLLLCGRGYGKTRTGSEWVLEQIISGNMRHIALVARTPGDARSVMVVGSEGGDGIYTGSALLQVAPPWFRPIYTPSTKTLVWPNGARNSIYSAEKPDQLRGPQHDGYWADEPAAWRFLQETWDQIMFGLRLMPRDGRPRGVCTTTPRPIPWVKDRLREANHGTVTVVTRGSTKENTANLAPAAVQHLYDRYGRTNLGRQELDGDVLDDTSGALLSRDGFRLMPYSKTKPSWYEVVVAIDPQKKDKKSIEKMKKAGKAPENDETGIVVCAKDFHRRGYVLEDFTGSYKPEVWARIAVEAYRRHGASCIVAEVNVGGDMVAAMIHTLAPEITVVPVEGTSSATKAGRAAAVAVLYRQGRIFHYGAIPKVEDQWCTWNPEVDSESPDALDACVYGLSYLLLQGDQYDAGEGQEFFTFAGRDWDDRTRQEEEW